MSVLIADKIMAHKRFDTAAMLRFGFVLADDGYRYQADLMDGDFTAVLSVSAQGKLIGKVYDNMNDEEYRQLWIEDYQGPYVNRVRTAYEQLLAQVAEKCCRDVLFASDQANRITERIATLFGVAPDYPWEQGEYQSYGVFRHQDTAKWFALIMDVKRKVLTKDGDEHIVDVVNLKADPDKIGRLTQKAGVYPAYHMNHCLWISVLLDDTLSDEEVMVLVQRSYDLTLSKKVKRGVR